MTTIHPVENLPDYHNFDYARLGSFSLSTRTTKYVMREDLITFNDLTETAPYHFRLYMQGRDLARKDAPTPITYAYYAEPSHWPHARYYDITRAYLQIARAFGAEVYVKEGKSVHYGDSKFDNGLFEASRVSRGLIVSGTDKRLSFDEWKEGHLQTITIPNSLYAPHLRATVSYTLHSIIQMIKRWCIYAHTDGLIVPAMYYNRVERFFEDWNIAYKIKYEGECVVKTRGTYSIGGYKTHTFDMWPTKRCDYIIDSKPLWWLQAYQKGREMLSS